MELKERAPVVAARAIESAAAPAVVGDVMADIDGWPRWNPAVKEAALRGSVAPGSPFRWKAGPGGITTVRRHVEPPRVLAWAGTTCGIDAIHVYWAEPRGGDTFDRMAESGDGWPARLLRGACRRCWRMRGPGLHALTAEAAKRAHR